VQNEIRFCGQPLAPRGPVPSGIGSYREDACLHLRTEALAQFRQENHAQPRPVVPRITIGWVCVHPQPTVFRPLGKLDAAKRE
jgi:hypothetical protein